MRTPRLVATDLDGTFLSPDGTVSAENARAVADAAAAGLPVVFVTGRPPRWLGVIADLPLAHPTVIASNGALVWDLAERQPLWAETIDAQTARDVIALVREELPGASFGVEQGLRFGFDDTYRLGLDRGEALRRPEFFTGRAEDMVGDPFVKLLIQHEDIEADELSRRVSRAIGSALTVTHSSWGSMGLLELSASGVTKAETLERYAAELGVAREDVAAFGDMPNDRTMLAWAGQPFVMAEAHPSLLDLPGVVRIGSNTESAVGRAIQEWL
ncbi:HAD family hydrolase [Granulicoccus sp. GXG6511]|uniref:HAD family hydrolase n=1 Tax=Granulicoccus sp. GXG6511 TaxID=3381351 RepID=UPI003D7DAD91